VVLVLLVVGGGVGWVGGLGWGAVEGDAMHVTLENFPAAMINRLL